MAMHNHIPNGRTLARAAVRFAALALAVGLAACGTAAPTVTPTAAPTVAPTAAAPPAATPAAGGATAPGTPRAGFGGVAGQVTQTGATQHLRRADGTTLTVTTGANTRVLTLAAGTPQDLKAGDFVTIQGAAAAGGAYTARAITDLGTQPGGGQRPAGAARSTPAARGTPRAGRGGTGFGGAGLGGVIRSIAGDTLTVQVAGGADRTVTLTNATTIRTERAGALDDVKVGDMVMVQGQATGTDTYAARTIVDQGP